MLRYANYNIQVCRLGSLDLSFITFSIGRGYGIPSPPQDFVRFYLHYKVLANIKLWQITKIFAKSFAILPQKTALKVTIYNRERKEVKTTARTGV